MKVAVCFSGHMRTYEKTHESFKKHLANRYDTKVFIHAWDTVSAGYAGGTNTQSVSYANVQQAYPSAIITLEKQRSLQLEDHPVLHTTKNPPIYVLSKMCSAAESFKLCKNWCSQHNEQFDVVVSCRSDMLFHENVHLSDEKDCVFTPGGNGGPPGTVHDYFAFGDMPTMERYFIAYNKFDEIVKNLNVSKFRAEEVLTHHLLTERVPLRYCSIEYSLCRITGEVRRMKA